MEVLTTKAEMDGGQNLETEVNDGWNDATGGFPMLLAEVDDEEERKTSMSMLDTAGGGPTIVGMSTE